ncbi:MAG: dihydrofolate reductase [Rhodospirillales bacterium]|nr:dihydrofolate reductase [Rhodospirillales bacterium]
MRVSLIVAMASNRVIGRDGGMPWHLPEDLKYFKKTTLGKPVVMGRKTFESIGRPLPKRPNIVITRDASFAADGVQVVSSVSDALELAQTIASPDVDEVMIIGGGQIYAEALHYAERVYLTEIHASIDGDTTFPELPISQWIEQSREKGAGETPGQPDISFVVLDREQLK